MTESLSEELARLVEAYTNGERQNRQEAWNLIADFAVENCTAICAALARPTPSGEGWKLVPVEPTKEMLEAVIDARIHLNVTDWGYRLAYRAMLSASPTHAGVEQPADSGVER